jgi:hypothetical protein
LNSPEIKARSARPGAVAQTAALSSFNVEEVSAGERHWLLGVAIGAAVMLGVSGFAAVRTGIGRRYEAVGSDDISAEGDTATDTDEDVAVILASGTGSRWTTANPF